MKIAFFEFDMQQQDQYISALSDHTLLFFKQELSASTIPPETLDSTVISIAICSQLSKEVLQKFSDLQLLVIRATGYDNVDLTYAENKSIIVTNAPRYAEIAVAEYTIGLMITLLRKITFSTICLQYEQTAIARSALCGYELADKAVGIIGTGNIGKEVIKRLACFSTKLYAYDIAPNEELRKNYAVKYVSLEELLRNVDIISLHVPLNKHTYHLLNATTLHFLKPGTFLINTARGAVIETCALVDALKEGLLAGTALDVLEHECFVHEGSFDRYSMYRCGHEQDICKDNIFLLNHPHVIITPHNAFNTHEAQQRLHKKVIEIIQQWTQGKTIQAIYNRNS